MKSCHFYRIAQCSSKNSMTLSSFSMTFQTWKIVFLNSVTFHDQGAPCISVCVAHWDETPVKLCPEYILDIIFYSLFTLKIQKGVDVINNTTNVNIVSKHVQNYFFFLGASPQTPTGEGRAPPPQTPPLQSSQYLSPTFNLTPTPLNIALCRASYG